MKQYISTTYSLFKSLTYVESQNARQEEEQTLKTTHIQAQNWKKLCYLCLKYTLAT